MLEQVNKFDKLHRNGTLNPIEMKAHLEAYRGNFDQMAETLTKANMAAVAGKIFTQMKMFSKAKEFYAQNQDNDNNDFSYTSNNDTEPNHEMKKLFIEEAKWKYNNNEYKKAANLYIQAYKYTKAIDIYGKHNLPQDMISFLLFYTIYLFVIQGY